jgi:hypothetical protein
MRTKAELAALLPKDRNDVANAKAIIALGYPTVEPVLRSLFQWLETSGSEVELVIRPFFATLGEPALDLVKEALEGPTKPARKAALLRYVLPSWPKETIAKIEPQLLTFLDGYDFHGLDVWALKLLLDKGVGPREELMRWKDFKRSRLQEHLGVLS